MLLYVIALLVAGLTAFYMFRIYFGIFWNKDPDYATTPHESPATMTIPLIILAVFSAFAGFVPFGEFLSADRMALDVHINVPLALIAIATGISGIGLAWLFYKKETKLPDSLADSLGKLYTWSYHKFYIDEIYLFITKKVLFKRVAEPAAKFDRQVVDGTMVGIGNSTVSASEKIKGMQSGKVQDYAMAFVAGVLVIVIFFVYYLTQ